MPDHELELHVISTGKQELKRFAHIAGKIHNEVTAIHIREKSRTPEEIMRGVQLLLEAGVPMQKIRINGCVEASLSVGVGGIHLPSGHLQENSIRMLCFDPIQVGASIHSAYEARVMERLGVHYVLFGHVYETSSKPGFPPRGIQELTEVVRQVSVPVVAIGGITPERVQEVIQCGAKGVAVMSGILEAANPYEAANRYAEELHAAAKRRAKLVETKRTEEVGISNRAMRFSSSAVEL
jgi:thiazole tautomerase (transcriptional regulator TenI)